MFTLPPITLPGIDEYAEAHSAPDPAQLAGVTGNDMGMGHLVSGRLVSGLLRMFIHSIQPKLILDIGTFTGYSALSMAVALPDDSRVISCEIDPERAEVARKNIAEAGYADVISVRVGPALDTIAGIEEPLDLVFIDADKPNYHSYYSATLPKLAPRGLIACDNTLWRGEIIDADSTDSDVRALRQFNDAVAADPRCESVMLTVRDGVTLIRRA
ncbi:O-methyltransferase [Streptomyces sp. NBC_01197]|uniref:O-methyltransferase n=1 Tax=Streptomyces sp. NBC_01197 TaxID=2903768 RepID=UPI002E142FEC|nr:O-methyltransferase [Streptomyces sp. NBC_01197]